MTRHALTATLLTFAILAALTTAYLLSSLPAMPATIGAGR